MQTVLNGMKLWYRLTSLGIQGRDKGVIAARINPDETVESFVAGSDEAPTEMRDAGDAHNESSADGRGQKLDAGARQQQAGKKAAKGQVKRSKKAPSAEKNSSEENVPTSRQEERNAKVNEAQGLVNDESSAFKSSELEDRYQAYLVRKRNVGEAPRDRADWKVASDETREGPMGRGNRFNETRRDAYPHSEVHLIPPYKEAERQKSALSKMGPKPKKGPAPKKKYRGAADEAQKVKDEAPEVKSKKEKKKPKFTRLDGYTPPTNGKPGEIVSRKAVDFDMIDDSAFKGYLKEIEEKYARGTLVRVDKPESKEIDGTRLSGDYILEVPDTNLSHAADRERFEAMAAAAGVVIRYAKE